MRARPVAERMAEAKARMVSKRRTPRVFFLSTADYREFEATDPPAIRAAFNSLPIEVLGFEGIAVRPSASARADYRGVLYCCIGTTVAVAAA